MASQNLKDLSFAELRELAESLGVQPARSKAETIKRIQGHVEETAPEPVVQASTPLPAPAPEPLPPCPKCGPGGQVKRVAENFACLSCLRTW